MVSIIESDFNVSLNEILNFLRKNETVTIEIGGHTNGVPPTE